MESKYDHKSVEGRIYQMWEEGGYFTPKIDPKKEPFTIILPPPNANGQLHLGHALYAVEDILVRYHRMKGDPTLWLPGMDHAGIESQYEMEKELKKQGKSRFDYPREEFYQMMWEFCQNFRPRMRDQLKRIGFSLDWSREKFTLDPDVVEIVNQTFQKMRADGLVYEALAVVNWCPRCGTGFSDLEVEYEEKDDILYFLNYGPVMIATTRPETIFADVAVAVNPKDKRFKKIIGQKAVVPLISKRVPIIEDLGVDPKFGTGALKITPGHDFLDYEIGLRHDLEQVSVLDLSGKMIAPAPEKYQGLRVKSAREAVVNDLRESGVLIKEEPYRHSVGVCYRCQTIIEPLLARQWFIKVKPLIGPAIKAVKDGRIKILPKRFEKSYFHWMENLRDWNISRQIVWGIKIPVEKATDTFDTWFSSGQWPFVALMANQSGDFAYFYPTTVMETGYDILYKWVARMIMLGLYVTGKVPFEVVYLHGLIRDRHGNKMSKSKGNVINPLDMIEKYGADALRFSLIANVGPGQDQRLYEEKIIGYRNFSNKLWNIGRFILLVETRKTDPGSLDPKLLKSLKLLKKTTTKNLDNFKLGIAAEELYQFIWHEFADKYIEDYKKGLISYAVLSESFETLLKLLHPFMPFVTEEIWGLITEKNEKPLIASLWPGRAQSGI